MKKIAAVALVLSLVAIVVAALTTFAGGFDTTVPVTVTSERAGLVMDPQAKVRLRGVEVGRVASMSHDGDTARINLDLDPDMLWMIPANAAVEIKSTTVFGAKNVNFLVPASPSNRSLEAGAVISADNVTVEFNTLFEHLSEVLQKLEPDKLNATLGAVSSAGSAGSIASSGTSSMGAAAISSPMRESAMNRPSAAKGTSSGATSRGSWCSRHCSSRSPGTSS